MPAAAWYMFQSKLAHAAQVPRPAWACEVTIEDMKRLIAYTSISHFGFIILGIFVMTSQGQSGSTLYMVNHGISTGALFLVVLAYPTGLGMGDVKLALLLGAFALYVYAVVKVPSPDSLATRSSPVLACVQTRAASPS